MVGAKFWESSLVVDFWVSVMWTERDIMARVRKCHYLFRDFSGLYCAHVIDVNVACRALHSNQSADGVYFQAPIMNGDPN